MASRDYFSLLLITALLFTSILCDIQKNGGEDRGVSREGTRREDVQAGKVEGPVIGIDLGTTYSCVAVFTKGHVEIITNELGNRVTPSWVSWFDGERLIGEGAKNKASDNPKYTVFNIKRLIGRSYDDVHVKNDIKNLPYKVIEHKGKVSVEIKQKDSTKYYTPEEISSVVLQKMKTIAEGYLGKEVKNAVVTVPAYFNDAQRQATKDAGTIAGLNVLRIVNEPTAAAIAYGLHEKKEKNILVYDLGGGTFDVSVLKIDDGFFLVLSTDGDTHLGGEDFDLCVINYLVKKFQNTNKIDEKPDSRAMHRLRHEVELAKKVLSSSFLATIEVENFIGDKSLKEQLTRAKFEELNIGLFKKTIVPLKNALDASKLKKEDIDDIVLVGGSTRIPKIQDMILEFFDRKKNLTKSINPDEAVAYGAAVQAGIISGEEKTDKLLLLDVTPLSLGIETAGGVMSVLIPRNTHIPVRKSDIFSTHQDNQDRVLVQVFEGERPMTKDNHLLGNFGLHGIAPAPRGVPRINVTFDVDTSGILSVRAEDTGSGKSEEIRITSEKGRLSEEEINRMVEEAKENEDADREVKLRAEARNSLENYLYSVRHTMKNDESIKGKISKEEIDNVNNVVDETTRWLEDNPNADKDDLDERRGSVEHVVSPIMQKIHQAGGANMPGEGTDADETSDGTGDEL